MIVLLEASHYKAEYIKVEEIFKDCFDRYFEKLYGYAFTFVKDNAEAKDIVQTAFVKLWEKRKEVNLSTSAQSYLYTSVYRLSLNAIRNRKIRETHHQKINPMHLDIQKDLAEEKEKRLRIQQAMDALPPRCREVFYKSRMEGKKYAAIASELEISIKTVEVQMGKALKILREQLADLIAVVVIYLIIH